jgi:hypothetical protein
VSAQEDHELFSKVAEMLGLDDDETGNFVSSAMTRRGHKAITSWADGEGESGGGGDFFSQKRGQREQRNVKSGGSDWQYRKSS